jgi:mono/diheme cytochrome c family protein
MNLTKSILITSLSALVLSSCIRDSDKPGREYIPDMAHSVAYDASTENPVYKNGYTNQLPPKGSVAQGKYIYPLANTPEAYEQAATRITNPFEFTADEISKDGKKLFNVNCAICHGETGDGNGYLSSIDKFPPAPSYFMEPLLSKAEGQRYHTLMYGKNMMGSYATQLNHRERWLVLSYVKAMQSEFKAKDGGAPATSSEATAPTASTTK